MLFKGLLLLFLNISGGLIYLYTIYFAFNSVGLLAALLSAALPVAANIYWMYSITMDTGDVYNNYNLACISLVIGYVLLMVFTNAGKENAENEE